ncbi:MAG: NADH-quinone oxidoreductase subunit F, partial [Spirochaetes bacterium]
MPVKEVVVGLGSCGIAAGARHAYEIFSEESLIKEKGIILKPTGCIGACHREPLVEIRETGGKSYLYGEVDEKRAREIIKRHVEKGEVIEDWLVEPGYSYFTKQHKIVLAHSGVINPEDIDEYLDVNGYEALKKVLLQMSPEEVIEEIKTSGLRGRGGAGFPTGIKWGFAHNSRGDKKYMICNADEGDPGAFMDRSVLEGDPQAVLEGMLIGAYAIGSDEGYIYVRAEYPLAIRRLKIAIAQAEEKGFLGKNILGKNFSFDVKIYKGAGAYMSGEETALLESIEGKRACARGKPPYPAIEGLFGKPTLINNVET